MTDHHHPYSIKYVDNAFCHQGSIFEVIKHSMFKSLAVHTSFEKYIPPLVDGVLEKLENAPYSIIDKGVYFCDRYIPGYYHFFAEFMPLAYLAVHETPEDFKIVLPSYLFSAKYTKEIINAMGINYIPHDFTQNVKFNQVAIPEIPCTATFNHDLMIKTRDWMCNKLIKTPVTTPSRKLYLSRKYVQQRRNINEDDVQKCFKKHGFHTIYLENHSIFEQIRYISEAKVIAATFGAGLTNMLWMKPGTKIVEMRMKDDPVNDHFENLAAVLDIGYHTTENNTTSREVITTDFEIDIDALDAVLEQLPD